MSENGARDFLSGLFPDIPFHEIGDDTDLFQSGIIDSFQAVILLEAISQAAGRPVADFLENLDGVSSISSIHYVLNRGQ